MKPVRVWVDALCINQADIPERNVQVAIMGKIYAAARKVYVYLGEFSTYGDDSIEEDMDALEKVLNLLERRDGDTSTWPLDLKNKKFLQVWFHIFLIHQNSWFRRAWVLQEVGLAKNPRVLYGRWEIGYKLLMETTVWLSLHDEGDFRLTGGSRVHLQWMDWLVEPPPDLTAFDLLQDARALRCQDPRDHIYAFLSHPLLLNGELGDSLMAPDYNKDAFLLFRELSHALVRNNDIRFLGCLQHTEDTIAEGIPSWVIRWEWWATGVNGGQFSLPGFRHRERRKWKASEGIKGHRLVLSGDLMQVDGVAIDAVLDVYHVTLKHEESDIQFLGHSSKTNITPSNLCNHLG